PGDRAPDTRSDMYSLGDMLYFLVTGRPPFDDAQPMKVIIAHAHDPVVPPSQVNEEVTDDLELVILRCLQKNPDDRYQSAADLAAALEECNDYDCWTRDDARRWWEERESSAVKAAEEMALG